MPLASILGDADFEPVQRKYDDVSMTKKSAVAHFLHPLLALPTSMKIHSFCNVRVRYLAAESFARRLYPPVYLTRFDEPSIFWAFSLTHR